MATLYKSQQSQGARPPVTLSQAGQVVSIRGFFAQTAAMVLNDTFQLLKWPAAMSLDDLIFDYDGCDSNAGPAAILQVGILNAAGTALLGPVLIATTAAQSKLGGINRPVDFGFVRSLPRTVPNLGGTNPQGDRFLGVLVQTGPATGVAPVGGLAANKGVWQASTAYVATDFITLPNGQVMKCTTGGVTGLAFPDWNGAYNTTTNDGTVVWTANSVVFGLTARFKNQIFGA